MGYMPEQVQDFYPTPSTISTVMYYTGVDPRTMQKVYVPSDPAEKAMQRALIQYRKPENYDLVKKALLKAGREDLIGFDRKKCLIPPRKLAGKPAGSGKPAGGAKTSGCGKTAKMGKPTGGRKPAPARGRNAARQRGLNSKVSKI